MWILYRVHCECQIWNFPKHVMLTIYFVFLRLSWYFDRNQHFTFAKISHSLLISIIYVHSLAIMLACDQYIYISISWTASKKAQWQPDYVSLDLIQLPLGVCLLHSIFVSICFCIRSFIIISISLFNRFRWKTLYLTSRRTNTKWHTQTAISLADCSKSFRFFGAIQILFFFWAFHKTHIHSQTQKLLRTLVCWKEKKNFHILFE